MDASLITRINELAHKAKAEGLTPEEQAEQTALRNEYRAAFRRSLVDTLEHTTIVDEQGTIVRRVGRPPEETE